MNPLESHIQTQVRASRKPGEKLDEAQERAETETLNRLQDRGIISDNCVTASDVGNARDAVAWLKEEDRKRNQ